MEPVRFDRELFFSCFLTTLAKDFPAFLTCLQPSCSSSPAALLPTHSDHTTGSTATTGALIFNIRTLFPLVLSRTLGVSLSSLNELVDPHRVTESLTCDPQVSADNQTVVTFSFALGTSIFFLAGVAATASAEVGCHPRDAQEGLKSQNEGAHHVQPTIVCSILPQIDRVFALLFGRPCHQT